MPSKTTLADRLIAAGRLQNPAIIKAFRAVKRADFLPKAFGDDSACQSLAELDDALPIGFGQTISQPSVVAFMLEMLDPRPDQKILDIGAGSGWTAALLAQIVGRGRVVALETVPELKEFGQANIAKYDFIKKGAVRYELADGTLGFPDEAPFDRILASAAGQEIPPAWKEQLKTGGIIVAPVKNSIFKITKTSGSKFIAQEYPGFVFVPLVSGTR